MWSGRGGGRGKEKRETAEELMERLKREKGVLMPSMDTQLRPPLKLWKLRADKFSDWGLKVMQQYGQLSDRMREEWDKDWTTTNVTKMWSILVEYYPEEGVVPSVSLIDRLFWHHFGQVPEWSKWFTVINAANFVFSLQEWVDSWFDPAGILRCRVRRRPATPNDDAMDRREKQSLILIRRHIYAFVRDDAQDSDDLAENGCIDTEGVTIPPLPSSCPQPLTDEMDENMYWLRKKMFCLLLRHFPHDGIELEQLLSMCRSTSPVGFNPFGTFYGFHTDLPDLFAKYMPDLIKCTKVSPMHTMVTYRLDAPGLLIAPSIMQGLSLPLQKIYSKQKNRSVASTTSDDTENNEQTEMFDDVQTIENAKGESTASKRKEGGADFNVQNSVDDSVTNAMQGFNVGSSKEHADKEMLRPHQTIPAKAVGNTLTSFFDSDEETDPDEPVA